MVPFTKSLVSRRNIPVTPVFERSRMSYSLDTSREITGEDVLEKREREPPSCKVVFCQQSNKVKIARREVQLVNTLLLTKLTIVVNVNERKPLNAKRTNKLD